MLTAIDALLKRITVWQFILLWLGSIVLTTWIVRQEIAFVRWAMADDKPVRYTVPSMRSPAISKIVFRTCPDGSFATSIDPGGEVDCGDGQATHFSADGVVTCVDNPIAPAYAVEKLNITNAGSVHFQTANRLVGTIRPDGTFTVDSEEEAKR